MKTPGFLDLFDAAERTVLTLIREHAGKVEGMATPGLEHYRRVLEALLE